MEQARTLGLKEAPRGAPRKITNNSAHNRKQFSSLILFMSAIIFVNLCPPFQRDFEYPSDVTGQMDQKSIIQYVLSSSDSVRTDSIQYSLSSLASHIEACLRFTKLMFTNPMRLGKRTTSFSLAEARVLSKMAKVWYIKKKIKKLSKKLKKHTIAVPVITAIPIYEHSYYPQPHVTHVTHAGTHHAASSYSPVVTQAVGSSISSPAAAASNQQMVASASNNHHSMAAYRLPPNHHHAMYPMHAMGSQQIINAYPPSPPVYVDDAGGLYGHYGNAYGRYDGGYQLW